MRYISACCDVHEATEAYRVYMSECMRLIAGVKVGYYELMHPRPDFDVGTVIEDVIARSGLEVI